MQADEIPLTPKEQLHQAFLMKWVKGAWEGRSGVTVSDYMHPECVLTGMSPERLEGPDQVQAVVNSLHARVDHTSAEVSYLLMRGEQFALVMELQGTHRESGADVVIEVSVFGCLRDDLIYRAHNVVDYTSMYARLGILNIRKLHDHFG